MVWGIIAAWLICLASLSLPWPGIVLVVLLCFVAFFELASPSSGSSGGDGAKAGVLCEAVRRSPSAAVAKAFHFMAERLGGSRKGGGGEMEELATSVEKDAIVQHSKRAPSSAAGASQQVSYDHAIMDSYGYLLSGVILRTMEILRLNFKRTLHLHPYW